MMMTVWLYNFALFEHCVFHIDECTCM